MKIKARIRFETDRFKRCASVSMCAHVSLDRCVVHGWRLPGAVALYYERKGEEGYLVLECVFSRCGDDYLPAIDRLCFYLCLPRARAEGTIAATMHGTAHAPILGTTTQTMRHQARRRTF